MEALTIVADSYSKANPQTKRELISSILSRESVSWMEQDDLTQDNRYNYSSEEYKIIFACLRLSVSFYALIVNNAFCFYFFL